MKKNFASVIKIFAGCLIIISIIPMSVNAQKNDSSDFDRDTLIKAAEDLMIASRYCGLITLDDSGHPQIRTMDPFAPEEDLTVWFGTNSASRKVREIKNDSRVTIYYQADKGTGYVVVRGNAVLVDDEQTKKKYWKDKWEEYYSEKKENYLLIKVVPEKLEIVDYTSGIVSKSETWAAPSVELK